MTITVTIPQDLAAKLRAMAERQGADPEQFTVDLLMKDLTYADSIPTLEEVVAQIWSLPPSTVILAKASLLEYLERTMIDDPDFDADEWDRQWAVIEAETKANDLVHQIAESNL